jgi:hypothetical protein
MITILIETEPDGSSFAEFQKTFPDSIQIIASRHLDASQPPWQALVTLSYITVPLVAKILIEHIRSKKNITVKYKGVRLKGLSEATAEKILSDIIKKEGHKK